VRKKKTILGDELTQLLSEVSAIYQDETQLREKLQTLYEQTTDYATTYGAMAKGKKKK
jgi:CRISPR-associated protein Csc2